MANVNDEVKKSAAEEAAQIDLELKRAALAREQQMLRKAELENARLERDINQMDNAEESHLADAKSHGASIEAANRDERIAFSVCTHKKGGNMLVYPKGDATAYAIMRHRLPSGDMFIRCLRCGKEWLPPAKPMPDDKIYKTAKGFNETQYRKDYELFKMKVESYREALAFPTDNADSASPRFQFKDQNVARRAFRGTNPPGSYEMKNKTPISALPGGLPPIDTE